jgi:hypothetical protein
MLRCTDLVPDDWAFHCTSCHEDEEYEPCPHPLLEVTLVDGREAEVCCRVSSSLEDEGLLPPNPFFSQAKQRSGR